jgi:hypothetical protein
MNALASAGHDIQSAAEMPEGGAVIASSLLLRSKRESGCRQGLARLKAPSSSSHPLNGYAGLSISRNRFQPDLLRLVLASMCPVDRRDQDDDCLRERRADQGAPSLR